MSDTSFKMTTELAGEIKDLRKRGCSWRMVAQRFAEGHPGLPVDTGNQIEGMCLCEEAGKCLKEDHYSW